MFAKTVEVTNFLIFLIPTFNLGALFVSTTLQPRGMVVLEIQRLWSWIMIWRFVIPCIEGPFSSSRDIIPSFPCASVDLVLGSVTQYSGSLFVIWGSMAMHLVLKLRSVQWMCTTGISHPGWWKIHCNVHFLALSFHDWWFCWVGGYLCGANKDLTGECVWSNVVVW